MAETKQCGASDESLSNPPMRQEKVRQDAISGGSGMCGLTDGKFLEDEKMRQVCVRRDSFPAARTLAIVVARGCHLRRR
jgi:hypothetical protein